MTLPEQSLPSCICGNPACTIPYGTCHCGCGNATNISIQNQTRNGYIKGRPKKWFLGHTAEMIPLVPEQAVPFKIVTSEFPEGVYCRLIPLTQGQYAIVDEVDYWKLATRKWMAFHSRHGNCFYAIRHGTRVNGKPGRQIWMHRELLGLDPGDPREGDHVDPQNTLNNSRSNLRIATRSQQGMNQRISSRNRTGFKGVSFRSDMGMYRAEIMVDGVHYRLGYFREARKAGNAYEEASKKYHGKFGRIR